MEMFEEIMIKKTNGDGGFIVEVGCKTFVAKTEKELFKGLSEYWADPEKAEKKHVKIKEKELRIDVHVPFGGGTIPNDYSITE